MIIILIVMIITTLIIMISMLIKGQIIIFLIISPQVKLGSPFWCGVGSRDPLSRQVLISFRVFVTILIIISVVSVFVAIAGVKIITTVQDACFVPILLIIERLDLV